MSQSLIDTTALLCRLLESSASEIAGPVLCDPDQQAAWAHLRREQLIGFGEPLNWLQCPECGVEMARVVRDLSADKVLLLCGGDCQDFEASRSVRQTMKVNVERVLGHLLMGLGLNRQQLLCLVPGKVWRLGLSGAHRRQPPTWYFAAHLNRDPIARQLLEHLREQRADRHARILTSSPAPLPASSPLSLHGVMHLADVARLSQSRFEFWADCLELPSAVSRVNGSASDLGTTLRYVRTERKAYIDGIGYALEPMQVDLLLALMDDFDHRMESAALRQACGSTADPFSPVKYFDRNKQVYKTFIRYDKGDKEYALVIPEEDRDTLT